MDELSCCGWMGQIYKGDAASAHVQSRRCGWRAGRSVTSAVRRAGADRGRNTINPRLSTAMIRSCWAATAPDAMRSGNCGVSSHPSRLTGAAHAAGPLRQTIPPAATISVITAADHSYKHSLFTVALQSVVADGGDPLIPCLPLKYSHAKIWLGGMYVTSPGLQLGAWRASVCTSRGSAHFLFLSLPDRYCRH